jgi:hypothetical protein
MYLEPAVVYQVFSFESSFDFNNPIIYLSPRGKLFNQDMARNLVINNKGINLICGRFEGIDERVIEKFNIQDDDMIIKFTGRYLLFNDEFFSTVLENHDKDSLFRDYNVCTYETGCNHMVLGMFALRCKYFKFFNYDRTDMGAEEDFRIFINDYVPPDKLLIVKKLWLRVCLGMNNKIIDC